MRPFAASTHPGYKRSNNEDCFEAAPELGLWLVADGVGGHASGEVASAIVANTLRSEVAAGIPLADAVRHCHAAVLNEIREQEGLSDMGSTVVAVHLEGNAYQIAWVGDSRAYRWNGELSLLTHDHNPVAQLLEQGLIDAEEAASHPERHVLTQSLGVSENMLLEPGCIEGELGDKEQLLLCSDGLSDELPDAEIALILGLYEDPQAQVDALVEAALAAGGRDNVTVLIVGTPPQLATQSSEQERRATVKMEPLTQDSQAGSGPRRLWFWAGLAATAVLGLLVLWYWPSR